MASYETGYQALGSFPEEENDDDIAPAIHILPEGGSNRWNHIQNLDDFFFRVYSYHQRNGFNCMIFDTILQLLSMLILGGICLCLWFVNYDLLFSHNHIGPKLTIPAIIIPLEEWPKHFNFWLITIVIMFCFFFLSNMMRFLYNTLKYLETKKFYSDALKIPSTELENFTWHDVLTRLLEVQKEQQMCIHKQELTELDIYHRILRFKNYMIAMVNKSLLPLKFRLPFVGECVFLSTGLKTNIEMLLFYSPWAPFDNWHLRSEYKNIHKRKELAKKLSNQILWAAIANFVLSPIIFGLQIMYTFFKYTEILKRDPSQLGLRRWSNYAHLYLRHFNELDHEFHARLSRGYSSAVLYMNIFTSPMFVLFAKYGSLVSGAFFAILFLLTVLDSDVFDVEYVFGLMTAFGFLTATLHKSIPPEHEVYNPESLMRSILRNIHYMPDNWNLNAHTNWVRDEFAQLFQYRFVYLLEELISPIVTPIILCFWIRPKSLEIVDFLRNFTVDVVGVGDVCSFAQMDVRRHGNIQFFSPQKKTLPNQYQQAEDSKTELSLIHFRMTNPKWKAPEDGNSFLTEFREQVVRDFASLSMAPLDNPPLSSFNYFNGTGTNRENAFAFFGQSTIASNQPYSNSTPQQPNVSPGPHSGFSPGHQTGFSSGPQSGFSPGPQSGFSPGPQSGFPPGSPFPSLPNPALRARMKGAVASCEGPIGLWASNVTGVSSFCSSGVNSDVPGILPILSGLAGEKDSNLGANEMSVSALYLHDLKHRQNIQGLDSRDENHPCQTWRSSPDETQAFMPSIQEKNQGESSTESQSTDKQQDYQSINKLH